MGLTFSYRWNLPSLGGSLYSAMASPSYNKHCMCACSCDDIHCVWNEAFKTGRTQSRRPMCPRQNQMRRGIWPLFTSQNKLFSLFVFPLYCCFCLPLLTCSSTTEEIISACWSSCVQQPGLILLNESAN